MKKYISFDVGGTKVKHGLLQENGTILAKGSYHTQCSNLEGFLKDMVHTAKVYTEHHHISGIAVSLPGSINPETGFSERSGSVTALSNQNLKILLEKRISLQVEVENDGNCAAIAEKISGNAINCSDFICVTIGTGIGGGIFIDGKLLRGHSFRGGEFGFMITQAGRKNSEILHLNASTSALVNSYIRLRGIRTGEKINGETVFSEAQKNIVVKGLIDDWIKNICYGIYNLAATLNPQKILIGGGVSDQQGLLSNIKNQLDQLPWWKEFEIPVEICRHRNDAGMIGAMYHLRQKQGM